MPEVQFKENKNPTLLKDLESKSIDLMFCEAFAKDYCQVNLSKVYE